MTTKQYTIEVRGNFTKQGQEAMKAACQVSARNVLAVALLAHQRVDEDGYDTPPVTVVIFSDEFFEGPAEIKLFDEQVKAQRKTRRRL